eukprot:449183-Rhodomonas_salina.1
MLCDGRGKKAGGKATLFQVPLTLLPIPLPLCYALPGTVLDYAATCYAVCGTNLGYTATRLLRSVRYLTTVCAFRCSCRSTAALYLLFRAIPPFMSVVSPFMAVLPPFHAYITS